jgi:hypothetical protein
VAGRYSTIGPRIGGASAILRMASSRDGTPAQPPGEWFKLRELHRGHIRDFLARKRGAGLGKNSVRLIRAVLLVLLSDAVDV